MLAGEEVPDLNVVTVEGRIVALARRDRDPKRLGLEVERSVDQRRLQARHVGALRRKLRRLDHVVEEVDLRPGGVVQLVVRRVAEAERGAQAYRALEQDDVAAGYVLACQSYPLTERVVLSFDDR